MGQSSLPYETRLEMVKSVLLVVPAMCVVSPSKLLSRTHCNRCASSAKNWSEGVIDFKRGNNCVPSCRNIPVIISVVFITCIALECIYFGQQYSDVVVSRRRRLIRPCSPSCCRTLLSYSYLGLSLPARWSFTLGVVNSKSVGKRM